jgi:hypothetical protein
MEKISIKKEITFWLILLLIIPIIWILFDLFITKIFFKVENQNIYPRISSKIFHHTLDSNVNVIEENGRFGKTRLITNSIGFRDKEARKIYNETSKYRIVFIGGSYTEGFMVNYEDSFVGIIDKKLKKYNIDVLNAGVVGYSPSIYYAKIKYFLDKNFKFDELIIYIDVEDITAEAFVDRLEVAKSFDSSVRGRYSIYVAFLKKNLSTTYKVLNFISDSIDDLNRTSNNDEKKLDEFILGVVSGKTHGREMWTVDKEIYKIHENGVNKSLKYMKLLRDLCIENNIKLTIAVFPHTTQIYYNDLDSIHVKIWKKFSLENDVNFINYFPYFIDKKFSLEERIKVIKKYFRPFDIHPNNEASKLIADIFLKKFIPSLKN